MPSSAASAAKADAPADTRERILDVAADLFTEQGYEGTSLREIADRMGFTKAALYYHFHSKEDILRALVEPVFTIQGEFFERLGTADSMEQWANALGWIIQVMFDNFRLFGLVERNRAALATLAESSAFFEEHQRMHQVVEDAINRQDRPFGDRVRMICALGAVAGFDDFAPRFLLEADRDQLHAELTTVMRQILGLPKSPRRTARPRPS